MMASGERDPVRLHEARSHDRRIIERGKDEGSINFVSERKCPFHELRIRCSSSEPHMRVIGLVGLLALMIVHSPPLTK
jgi:hypothetical protein